MEAARYDVVVRMYQALGRWTRAIAVCEQHDRVNLAAAYFEYARFLRESGKVLQAIPFYEKAGCAVEIAQMLHEERLLQRLADYAATATNAKLLAWYARYLESHEQPDEAAAFYERAGDYASMVRLCCDHEQLDKARAVVAKQCAGGQAQHLGAAFHLATHLEEQGDVDAAIGYFRVARASHHALRLAKEHALDQVVLDIALEGQLAEAPTQRIRRMAAEYFAERGELSKAVMLFRQAGALDKAMDLCLAGQLFGELRDLAASLGQQQLTPSVALRFSDYFADNAQGRALRGAHHTLVDPHAAPGHSRTSG